MTTPQLITIGRVSVDLYAQQPHRSMTEVESFQKSIGGSSTNVAVAAARLGLSAATVTKVGDDQFGDYVRHALEHTFGVDSRWVSSHPELPTPLAFAELDPPEDPTIIFYRYPSAPDLDLALEDVPVEAIVETDIFWVPASRFHAEPSAATVTELLRRRGRKRHTVLDLDWRPMFWESPAAAHAAISPMLDHVSVAIGNRTECEVAVGTADPDAAADALLERGVEIAVVKLGGDGVMVATADGRDAYAPYPVDVVCGLGSGDAFGGAFSYGLAQGWELDRIARYANAAGAIVAGRMMCADDMPTLAEIESFLTERGAAT